MKLFMIIPFIAAFAAAPAAGKGLRADMVKDLGLNITSVSRKLPACPLIACDPSNGNGDCQGVDGCNVCRKVGLDFQGGDWHICMPGCGGDCNSDADCPSECNKCYNNKCSKCKPGHVHILTSKQFRRGPWCAGHKKGVYKHYQKCTPGYTRVDSGTSVTSHNADKVACGRFKRANHDASPADWISKYDDTNCGLMIPYCEHYCGLPWAPGDSTCVFTIKEKCTKPYG